jgi:SAM-dependent methyltransferase
MLPETFAHLAQKQSTYWWNRARRSMAAALLRRYGATAHGQWLDVGCGPGGNLMIADSFQPDLVVGVDLSPVALELAQSNLPHVKLVRADLSRGLPFPEGTFTVATVFNVIYHNWVKDDRDALAEVARVLRHKGLMLITEPAFPILSREWDNAVMGVRRYRRLQLIEYCRQAGFKTLFASYFTSFGFPILLGLRALKPVVGGTRPRRAAEFSRLPSMLNESLFAVALLEAKAISLGLKMPFGVTLTIVAARESSVGRLTLRQN